MATRAEIVKSKPRVRGFSMDHAPNCTPLAEQTTWVVRRGCCGHVLTVCVPDVIGELQYDHRGNGIPWLARTSYEERRRFALVPGRSVDVLAAAISIGPMGRIIGATPFEAVVTSEAAFDPLRLSYRDLPPGDLGQNIIHSEALARQMIGWKAKQNGHDLNGSAATRLNPARIVEEFIAATNWSLTQYVIDQGGGQLFNGRGGKVRPGSFTAPIQKKESLYFQMVLKMLLRGHPIDDVFRYFNQNHIDFPFSENLRRRRSGSSSQGSGHSGGKVSSRQPTGRQMRTSSTPKSASSASTQKESAQVQLQKFVAGRRGLSKLEYDTRRSFSGEPKHFRVKASVVIGNHIVWRERFGNDWRETKESAAAALLAELQIRFTS